MTQEVVTNSAQNNFSRYSHVDSEIILDGCQPSLQPDLSVMIPTFRRPHFLKEAIESVVNQTAHGINIEIVIVDNDAGKNSTELATLVESFFPNNIRLFRNKENIGMFGNWNRCIELARAPKLIILNDDDLLHPDFIRAVYEPDMKGMRVVTHKTFSTLTDCIWSEVKYDIKFTPLSPADFFIGNPVLGCLGMVMNKRCALSIGGYNPELWPTADYDFTYRYFTKYGLYKTNSCLSAYRWAENESLKVETLAGFLENDYKFRIKLVAEIIGNRNRSLLLSWLCNALAVYSAFTYKTVNSNFDVENSLQRASIQTNGLLWLKNSIVRKVFGRIYPAFVGLIFNFNKGLQ
ncbi:glycosyltransferase family 2 protein [Aeromonas enteropelogenes]|uniref:glycosyltransferase family 2 protein n=1 Tax=Aeromonas enteropelogenes TaxID=29489 RepID=UPI003BA3C861